MATPITPDTKLGKQKGVELHFFEGNHYGKCGRRRVLRALGGGKRICGEPREANIHLYYPCRKDEECGFRSWSLEMRENHEERDHVR